MSRAVEVAAKQAVPDFGTELPFAQAQQRLREHYDVEVPVSAVRVLAEQQELDCGWLEFYGVGQEIAHTDGSMVPVVAADSGASDKRMGKVLDWKEI